MKRLAVLLILSLFAAIPARAEWRRAESPNFVVYGNLSESRLRERHLGVLQGLTREEAANLVAADVAEWVG